MLRNCNTGADCAQARAEFMACQNAQARLKQIEAESKRNAELQRKQQEIDAVKKIEEANKKVHRTQGPN
jgi:hypothetical protein